MNTLAKNFFLLIFTALLIFTGSFLLSSCQKSSPKPITSDSSDSPDSPDSLDCIVVTVSAPVMSVAELEAMVLIPLENNLFSIKNVREVNSRAEPGQGFITVNTVPGADLWKVAEDIISVYQPDLLPPGVEVQLINKANERELVTLIIELDEFYYGTWFGRTRELVEASYKIPGISRASITGVTSNQLIVELEPAILARYALSPLAVVEVISDWLAKKAGSEGNSIYSIDDFEKIAFGQENYPNPVMLRDIAQIRHGYSPPESQLIFNGRRAIRIQWFSRSEHNERKVAKQKLQELIDKELSSIKEIKSFYYFSGMSQSKNIPASDRLIIELQMAGIAEEQVRFASEIQGKIGDQAEWVFSEIQGSKYPTVWQIVKFPENISWSQTQPIIKGIRERPGVSVRALTAEIKTTECEIYGDSLRDKMDFFNSVKKSFEGDDSVIGVSHNMGMAQNELVFKAEREQLARFGIPLNQVYELLKLRSGVQVGTVLVDGQKIPVRVELAPMESEYEQKWLSTVGLPSPNGAFIPLDQLVTLRREPGEFFVERKNGRRVFSVLIDSLSTGSPGVFEVIRRLAVTPKSEGLQLRRCYVW